MPASDAARSRREQQEETSMATPYTLTREFAASMHEAGESVVTWQRRYVVWARAKPLCRTVSFRWYSESGYTMRASVERHVPPWPRCRRSSSGQLYPDALQLAFSFHSDEAAIVVPWLRDLCLRRSTPLLESHFAENLARIRAGSAYEWTDLGWETCERFNAEQARLAGQHYTLRPNRPPT
jgi:hypothetical protein